MHISSFQDELTDLRQGLDLLSHHLKEISTYIDLHFKFDPNQPRVPAGQSTGGQWTSDGRNRGTATGRTAGGRSRRRRRQRHGAAAAAHDRPVVKPQRKPDVPVNMPQPEAPANVPRPYYLQDRAQMVIARAEYINRNAPAGLPPEMLETVPPYDVPRWYAEHMEQVHAFSPLDDIPGARLALTAAVAAPLVAAAAIPAARITAPAVRAAAPAVRAAGRAVNALARLGAREAVKLMRHLEGTGELPLNTPRRIRRAYRAVKKFMGETPHKSQLHRSKEGDITIINKTRKFRMDIKDPGLINARGPDGKMTQIKDKPHFHMEVIKPAPKPRPGHKPKKPKWKDATKEHRIYFSQEGPKK